MVAPVFFFNKIDRIYYSRAETQPVNWTIHSLQIRSPIFHHHHHHHPLPPPPPIPPPPPPPYIGTAAHCELWPVEQCPSIFSYLPPTLSIFSLPALEDLFLLPLYIFSCIFPFFSYLPVLEWRSFWASYTPLFRLGDLTSLSFALLSILLFLLGHLFSDFSLLPSKQPVNRHCSEKGRNTEYFQTHKIYCLNILVFWLIHILYITLILN